MISDCQQVLLSVAVPRQAEIESIIEESVVEDERLQGSPSDPLLFHFTLFQPTCWETQLYRLSKTQPQVSKTILAVLDLHQSDLIGSTVSDCLLIAGHST